MKFHECFRQRNNPRRVADGDEKPAKRAADGAGDDVAASAAVATVGKYVLSNNALSFRSTVPLFKPTCN